MLPSVHPAHQFTPQSATLPLAQLPRARSPVPRTRPPNHQPLTTMHITGLLATLPLHARSQPARRSLLLRTANVPERQPYAASQPTRSPPARLPQPARSIPSLRTSSEPLPSPELVRQSHRAFPARACTCQPVCQRSNPHLAQASVPVPLACPHVPTPCASPHRCPPRLLRLPIPVARTLSHIPALASSVVGVARPCSCSAPAFAAGSTRPPHCSRLCSFTARRGTYMHPTPSHFR